MKWVGLWHILGRKSKRKAGQGGGSCCLRVWKMERRVFSRCRRHNWEWCARWGPGLAIWFCRIHQGSAMLLFTWLFFVCLHLHYFLKFKLFKRDKMDVSDWSDAVKYSYVFIFFYSEAQMCPIRGSCSRI